MASLRSNLARGLAATAATLPSLIVDLAGILGAGSIAYGCWSIYEPAGFIVAGVMLIVAAWLLSRR